MATKAQIRCIARNLASKAVVSMDFTDAINVLEREQDRDQLREDLKEVSYSIVRKVFKSKEWNSIKIVKDILNNGR